LENFQLVVPWTFVVHTLYIKVYVCNIIIREKVYEYYEKCETHTTPQHAFVDGGGGGWRGGCIIIAPP
jgi:hypothetical protein